MLPSPISLSFWDEWFHNMVSELYVRKVKSSILAEPQKWHKANKREKKAYAKSNKPKRGSCLRGSVRDIKKENV
ncbi:uncharacterized protein DS421_12g359160 [Arachis hypogaea]|nr:uncharacterized protein DS421_12g359160 [Arachis hypogaea]